MNRTIRSTAPFACFGLGLFAALLGSSIRGSAADCEDAAVDPAFSIPATAIDLTPQLARWQRDGLYDAALIDADLAKWDGALSEMRILVVRGFLTDMLEPLERVGLSDYLKAQARAFDGRAAAVELLEFDSESSASYNARLIAQAVARSPERVCILSHSKGGVDTLEFLLRSDPALVDRIACWVSFQAPFHGAPLADKVAEYGALLLLSVSLLEMMGGSEETMDAMLHRVRDCYMREADSRIADIARRVPIVSVTSRIATDAKLRDHLSPALPALIWMRWQGIESDGLVPMASAILPHAGFVLLENVDHTGAVALGGLPEDQRILLTRALVLLALERPIGTVH